MLELRTPFPTASFRYQVKSRLLASLVAITVLSFFCIEKAAARYDPYLSDPTTSFFGRLIILNDELSTADGSEISIQQTVLLEAALQRFDLRGSKPTPTNRVSLQPPTLPTASGSGTNLSRDGSCAVGYQDAGFFTPFHALRWKQAGPVDLGTLDSANNASRSSTATDTNQDCSVVVGLSDVIGGGAEHAFRWTSAGMSDLGAPANGGPNSRAFGVSSNGTVVVGEADFPDPANLASGKSLQAFRWTQIGGFQNLNDSPQPTLSLATAVTGDGTVVVGQVRTSNNASSAVRWTFPPPPAQLVMQSIGPLPGHATAAATGVSDNGKIVVGISNLDFLQYRGPRLGWNGGIAFRWGESGPNAGMKDLRDLLVADGADLTGINLVSVTGISPDGQWIQGKATTSQTGPNETVAFIAQFCDENIVGGMAACATTAAPFTLGSPAQNNPLTVSAGQSVQTTITVTPNAGFNQLVSFACSGLQQGVSCNFNPANVTPPGTTTTTLTISTNAGPVAFLSPRSPTMVAALLVPFGLLPAVVLLRRREAGSRFLTMMGGCAVGLAMMGILSCNSSDEQTTGGTPATGTPAGTSTVTVTATSGSGNQNLPITLTVTR